MAGVHVSIGADSKKAERELSSFEKKTQKIAKSIQKGFQERIGHKLFDGLAGAARRIPGMLNDAIGLASSLNEEIGKSEFLFGKNAKAINDWAKTLDEALGLSELEAMQAAGTFGGLFRTMGMTEAQAADMSKRMIQLAVDMGSFNEESTGDAIQAIGAALRGESEPIRRFNVLLNDATLKAKAFEMGIHDGKSVLPPATKALASYEVILEQAAIQSGNFAETSHGLANSQKILQAKAANAQTQIGKGLVPVMTELVNVMVELDWKEIGDDIGYVAEEMANLARNVGDAYDGFKNMAEGVGAAFGSGFITDFNSMMSAGPRLLFGKDIQKLVDSTAQEFDKENPAFQRFQKQKEEAAQKKLFQDEKRTQEELKKKNREEADKKKVKAAMLAEDEKQVFAPIKMAMKQTGQEGFVREGLMDQLRQIEDQMFGLAGRSSNLAVSSMQSIGGGGGVGTTLDLQKRQAELQEKMVTLLSDIKEAQPMAPISDF